LQQSEISNNTITTGGSFENTGIFIRQGAGYNNFTLNSVTPMGINAVGGSVGIYGLSSSHNFIANNSVRTRSNGSNNTGIFLEEGQNNTVQLNNISANGTNNNHGIKIYNNRFNRILSNRITTQSNESTNIGILLQEVADGTLIDNNSIVTGGVGNAHGIFIQDNDAGAINQGASHNNISNNTIITNGTGGNNIGIFASTAHHRIIKNNISTNGSSDNHGVYFAARSQNNTLEGNNISINGTRSYAIFINDSNSSQFTNNTINISTVNSSIDWVAIVLGEGNNFTNTTFTNRNGSIRFPSVFTPNGTHNVTQAKLNLTNHTLFVNSTNLSFLNTSAVVSFINVTFSDPYPVFIGSDMGSGVECVSPQCTSESFTSLLYSYTVSQFTTYSASESNVSFTLTKTDSVDPVSAGSSLTYAITVSISSGNATNVTVSDAYPAGVPNNVLYVSSQPSPIAGTNNENFSLPNLSSGESFTVNVTVTVNASAVGVLNNTAILRFHNASGGVVVANVTETTTVRSTAGNGGGTVIFTPASINRGSGQSRVISPQPVVQAPALVVTSRKEAIMTFKKSPSLVSEKCAPVTPLKVKDVPNFPGYDIIGKVPCGAETVNLPNEYTDVQLLRCGASCEVVESRITNTISCDKSSVPELRKQERENTGFLISLPEVSNHLQDINQNPKLTKEDHFFEFSGINQLVMASLDFKAPSLLPSALFLSHELKVVLDKPGPFGVKIVLSYPAIEGVDFETIAVGVRKNNQWILLQGTVDRQKSTVTLNIENITPYLDGNSLTVAVVGNVCEECTAGKLVQEYSDGSRRAIILVHGLTARSTRFQNIIDEFALNKQPWQVWTYRYPYSRDIEVTGSELAALIESRVNEFDELSLLGHSLGGLVTEKAFEVGNKKGYQWVSKLQTAIIAGTPHQGSPAIEVYRAIFENSLALRSDIFYVNSNTVQLLAQGVNSTATAANYQVIAGTKSFVFTRDLFTSENDGVTTTSSASTIGGAEFKNRCKNYYDLPVTHIELDEHPNVINIIARILNNEIAAQNPQLPLVGYNQYLAVNVDCEQEYYVVGKKISESATRDPLLCACGNDVCGVGEDDTSCPHDCVKPKECDDKKRVINTLLVIGALLLIYDIFRRRGKSRSGTFEWIVIEIALVTLLVIHYATCGIYQLGLILAGMLVIAHIVQKEIRKNKH